MRKILGFSFLFLFFSFNNAFAQQTLDATLNIDGSSNLGTINPIWKSAASWKPDVWVNTPMSQNPTQNWFTNYFPFYDTLAVASTLTGTASSGAVPEVINDDGTYNFSFLDRAFVNMKRAGVIPYVFFGHTPRALSAIPLKYCGFDILCGPVSGTSQIQLKWRNLIAAFIDRYKNIYGDEFSLKWRFGSFGEADSGDPNLSSCLTPNNTDTYCCSFCGTEEQFLRDVLLPTLGVLKNYNLLHGFYLGPMIGVLNPAIAGRSPQNANYGISSSEWMAYLLTNIKNNGYRRQDFRSFAVNMYGVYPDNQNVFWIKDSLTQAKNLLRQNDFDLPISAGELGIIHNSNSNTPVYKTSFAASWFATVLKLYLDLGEGQTERVLSWWYLLVDNGFSEISQWKRRPAYYTFLMYHQLSNLKRVSVSGGIFDRNTLKVIDAVSGKDENGLIKTIVFNHNDNLTSAATTPDPNAPIADRSNKKVKVVFNNLKSGTYRLSIYQATSANIVSSPKDVPLITSQMVNVSSIFETVLDMPHHSVFFLTLENIGDKLFLKKGFNRITWPDLTGSNNVIVPSECAGAEERKDGRISITNSFVSGRNYFIKCKTDKDWVLD